MIEGLIAVLVLTFFSLIVGIIIKSMWIIVPEIAIVCIVVFLLVRVRVKIAKAEKEKLRAKIDELEQKITSIGKKEDE